MARHELHKIIQRHSVKENSGDLRKRLGRTYRVVVEFLDVCIDDAFWSQDPTALICTRLSVRNSVPTSKGQW